LVAPPFTECIPFRVPVANPARGQFLITAYAVGKGVLLSLTNRRATSARRLKEYTRQRRDLLSAAVQHGLPEGSEGLSIIGMKVR
jgi:hypothetical protein